MMIFSSLEPWSIIFTFTFAWARAEKILPAVNAERDRLTEEIASAAAELEAVTLEYKEKLEAEIRRHARKPYPEKGLEFFYSQPSQENGVIGAGIYAYTCL